MGCKDINDAEAKLRQCFCQEVYLHDRPLITAPMKGTSPEKIATGKMIPGNRLNGVALVPKYVVGGKKYVWICLYHTA